MTEKKYGDQWSGHTVTGKNSQEHKYKHIFLLEMEVKGEHGEGK